MAMTFDELYKKVLQAKADSKPLPDNLTDKEKHQLDCLLHPDKYPLVIRDKPCDCEDAECVAACMFHALEIKDGKVQLNPGNCNGCAACIEACKDGNLTFSHDTIAVLTLLKESETPVFALMAPAFVGQFGEEATPSKIRTALKTLGFAGMIEVAAFADILTLKEALEFNHNMENPQGFQLTSCCCPVWIRLIQKDFKKIAPHMPASVSPMIACGRIAKQLHRGCKTVFVGPCLAKKAEAREKDLEGAIDQVLTFEEMQDIFEAFKVDFSDTKEEVKEHSAKAGRMYARTGGVSKAVAECAKSFQNDVEMKAVHANGVSACKELLQNILDGDIRGNFFEGMACEGGCVGGPKRILDKEDGTQLVDAYADEAPYETPTENPYVLDLIKRLGFYTVEEFIKNSDILTRSLS